MINAIINPGKGVWLPDNMQINALISYILCTFYAKIIAMHVIVVLND